MVENVVVDGALPAAGPRQGRTHHGAVRKVILVSTRSDRNWHMRHLSRTYDVSSKQTCS